MLLFSPRKMPGLLDTTKFRRLVIVAIPFAALMDGFGSRLVQRFAISTPFSLTMLTWPSPRQRALTQMLAIANPPNDQRPLPQSEKLVREIAPRFQPAISLSGVNATKAKALACMGQCRILHFGVHGKAYDSNGLASYLLLGGNTEEDRQLTAAEISERPLVADLAVLMACETLKGEKRGGEGLMGVAWAFRAAGCPAVLASQWEVDEGSSVSLMRSFYTDLRRPGVRKDEALRKAMLSVMKENGRQSPYYWSGFQLMGITTPVFKADPMKN